MESVEQFIDQIIDDKGIELDEEVRNQLKIDLLDRLLTQIDRASINALPEDKAIELADKLDDENFTNEDVNEFMRQSGVNLERVALETMLQFRTLYLGKNPNVDTSKFAEAADE